MKGRDNLKKGLASLVCLTLIILLSGQIGRAQSVGSGDSDGVVLGASVARSDKEKVSKLPVETYFGDARFSDVNDQLKALSITVNPEDELTVFPEASFGIGTIIRITRATPVTIIDGNTQKSVRTWANTIDALFNEQGLDIGDDDKVTPARTTVLEPNQTITIVRVEVTKITEKESIPFKTITKDDPTLDKGKTKVDQVGKNGERLKIYQVRRENGQQVEKKLIDTQTSQQPVDQIVKNGTKVVVLGDGIATWFAAPTLTAASNTLPRGKQVLVTNKATGKSVQVTIIGGGIQGRAVIDLSPDAFEKLSPLGSGIINVSLTQP